MSDLPDYLKYAQTHEWAKLEDDNVVRVGITAVAAKLSGGKLAALTVKGKAIGQEVKQGKSVATVESSKFVGPVPAPATGVLVRANDKLAANPNLAIADPYGEGWIAEIKPSAWDVEKTSLITGTSGVAAYQAKLEADGVSCG